MVGISDFVINWSGELSPTQCIDVAVDCKTQNPWFSLHRTKKDKNCHTHFGGEGYIRAEFATLIFRFADVKNADIENPFIDLDNENWAYDEILALADSGLIEGYPDKTYKPEKNITRAEVMTVINKLLGRKPLESYVKSLGFNPYKDLYEDKWYYVTVLEATITHNYWLDDAGYEYKWEDWK